MPRYEGYGPPYNPIYATNLDTGQTYHWEYTSTYITHPAVIPESHWENRLIKQGRVVVLSKRGIPIRTVASEDVWAGLNWESACSKRELAEGWIWDADLGPMQSGEDRLGKFKQIAYRIKNPNKTTIGLGERGAIDDKTPLDALGDFFDPLGLIH